MKKVISFSLYGDDPLYLQGALNNAKLCPIVFPGWTCRFYVSQEIPKSLVDQLSSHGSEVIHRQRIDATDGMFWRFEAAGDSDLDAMIVRDTDSRLNARDLACVDQWLASGKTFHFVRDHPSQRKPILGGLWGCRGNAIPDIQEKIKAWKTKSNKGNDQHFLLKEIYPFATLDSFVQSPFTRYGNEKVHPIPMDRPNPWEYLGRPVALENESTPPDEADAIITSLKRPLRQYKLPLAIKLRIIIARMLQKK